MEDRLGQGAGERVGGVEDADGLAVVGMDGGEAARAWAGRELGGTQVVDGDPKQPVVLRCDSDVCGWPAWGRWCRGQNQS